MKRSVLGRTHGAFQQRGEPRHTAVAVLLRPALRGFSEAGPQPMILGDPHPFDVRLETGSAGS